MFKKLLLCLAMMVSLRAHSISGLISDNDTTAAVGLVLMDISQIYVVDTTVYRTRRSRVAYRTVRVFTYVPLFLAGLVILDDNGKMTFGELEADKASEAGVTADEAAAYNSELEELNAIKDMVSSEVADLEGSKEVRAEAAKELWTVYQDYVSPEAFSALVKLVKKTL
jgi:cell division protein FtsB